MSSFHFELIVCLVIQCLWWSKLCLSLTRMGCGLGSLFCVALGLVMCLVFKLCVWLGAWLSELLLGLAWFCECFPNMMFVAGRVVPKLFCLGLGLVVVFGF